MRWHLSQESQLPLYRQIVTLIERAIKSSQLLPGEKLPPERRLAELLSVNRSTVVRALDELAAAGQVIRVQGKGTHINEEKWGLLAAGKTNWRHYVQQGAFNASHPYIRSISELSKEEPNEVIDLATGELPIDLTPHIETPALSWQSFLAEEVHNQSLGYLPLRQAIQNKLVNHIGIKSTTEQILVTSGAQQALFLITQCLLTAGDAVAIEAPSYFYSLTLFQSAGLRIFAVPFNETGIDTKELERLYAKHRIKMIFVNPTFQNPTGLMMSSSSREKLISICARLQIPIVEDDPFGEFVSQTSETITPLKKMDSENVLYIGSLSKVMGATTRIGWLCGPQAVIKRLAEARQEMDFGLSIFPQVLASYVLTSDFFNEHLHFLQMELRKRRDMLINALEEALPGVLNYHVPSGGFHLWVELPGNQKSIRDFNFFLEKKLLVMPGFVFGVKENKIRLTFARITLNKAKKAAQILAEILQME